MSRHDARSATRRAKAAPRTREGVLVETVVPATGPDLHERGKVDRPYVRVTATIAKLHAAGRMDEMAVRRSDLDYGLDMAGRSCALMERGAAEYMAESDNQAQAQRVMRAVRSVKGDAEGWVTWRQVTVAMKHVIKARDLRDVVASLVEAGQLERRALAQARGGHPVVLFRAAT